MASSEVEICNIALQMLGAKPITSLSEASDRASIANQFYATARDETLRNHPWNFAQVRRNLAREVETPAWGFAYQYQLPSDPFCLRVVATEPESAEYTIEGRKILTDEPSLGILYTARVTDPTQFDASFVLSLAHHLAELMAYPLTKVGALSDQAYKKWKDVQATARSIDSQEGSTQRADINVLVDVRRHGFRDFNRSGNKFSF